MKQIELAQRLGISKSYLSMIMSGQRTPNQELTERLSSLGVVNSKLGNRFYTQKVRGSSPLSPTSPQLRSNTPLLTKSQIQFQSGLLTKFIASRRQGLSPRTIDFYEYCLTPFVLRYEITLLPIVFTPVYGMYTT